MTKLARHKAGQSVAVLGEADAEQAAQIAQAHEDGAAEAVLAARRRDRALLLDAALTEFAHGAADRTDLPPEVRAAAGRYGGRKA